MVRKCKPKKCSECKTVFQPDNSLMVVCGYKCALNRVIRKNKEKAARTIKQEAKVQRKAHTRAKIALKTKATWLKECQTAFNAYVRERDKGDNCISCGKSIAELKINHYIVMVCGHFLSVGAHGELRFNPLNAHLQCTRCNGGAGKYGNFNNKELTVTQNYRVNLINKIGQDKVDWLEGEQQIQHLSIDDIIEIKQHFKEQLRLIEDK